MTLPKHIQAEISALEQRHAALAADRAVISADMLEIKRQIRLLKYRRSDPLHLSMPARPVDAASDLLRVEILASQTAGFELPISGEGPRPGNAAGSGLGLTVARAWTACMGGRIQIEPEPLDGRLAWVELPLTVASSERRRHPIGSLAGRQVLLLAPEGLMAQTLAARLDERGLRPSRATEAETARQTLCAAAGSGAPFAALLVDARVKGLESLLSERSIQSEPALAALQRLLLVPRRAGWRDDQAAALAVTAQLTKPVTPGAVLTALTGAEPVRAETIDWILKLEK